MTEREFVQGKESLRLKGYDYSRDGAYFITIVTHEHKCLFGRVISGEVSLSKFGQIASIEWFKSSRIRAEIFLCDDDFVVMPNHIHGIVWLDVNYWNERSNSNQIGVRATGRLPIRHVEDDRRGPRPRSLSAFVAGYKASVTRKINKERGTPRKPVWVRNFYDRIIRNERELEAIREYIHNNPLKWELDRNFRE